MERRICGCGWTRDRCGFRVGRKQALHTLFIVVHILHRNRRPARNSERRMSAPQYVETQHGWSLSAWAAAITSARMIWLSMSREAPTWPGLKPEAATQMLPRL